jgi:hypothetical protein
MPIEVAIIFQGMSLGLGAAKYLGIIQETLAERVEQLAGSEFEAGMRALQQASDSEVEHESLLRETRGRFNKAVSLEKGLRLGLTQLGLALCHWHLGDRANARQAIRDLAGVQAPTVPLSATIAERVAKAPWWVEFLSPFVVVAKQTAPAIADWLKAKVLEEQAKLADLQRSAQACFPES